MPRRFQCTECGEAITTFMRVGEIAVCPGCGGGHTVPEAAEVCAGEPRFVGEARSLSRDSVPPEVDPFVPGAPSAGNLTAAGLFAATLILIPVSLALQFWSLEYTPGGGYPRPTSNVHTGAYLYASLLAFGALWIRPRPGSEAGFRTLMTATSAQGVIWLFIWLLAPIMRLAAGPGFGTPRIGFGSIALLVGFYGLFVAPVITGLGLLHSRRGGVLMLGQLFTWPWLFQFLSSWWGVT